MAAQPASPDPAPPRRSSRRWLRLTVNILVGILLFAIGLLTSILGLIAARWAFQSGAISVVGVLLIFLILPIWGTVFMRQRWPWVPFLAGGALALAWGDCLLMLIGMFHLIIRGSRTHALIATIIGSAVTVGSIIRMCLAPTALNPFNILFIQSGVPSADATMPAPPANTALAVNVITIVVGLLALGVSLGFGYLLRRARRMKSVEAFATHEAQRNEALTAELARQSERELLARELHDTLSHRLSVISLHSGALEVGGQGDSDVSAAAAALRQEAHASLEDLRHLVGGVREGTLTGGGPQKEQSTPPSLASMRSIPQLIASVQATGTVIRPSIIIQDVESAPTVLDRAVYRIVQESLTNAMKHAPGAPITLDVTVSADHGTQILIANPTPQARGRSEHRDPLAEVVPPRPSAPPIGHGGVTHAPFGRDRLSVSGSGAGLEGIRERTAMLDGQAEIGIRVGDFVVEVTLPSFDRRG